MSCELSGKASRSCCRGGPDAPDPNRCFSHFFIMLGLHYKRILDRGLASVVSGATINYFVFFRSLYRSCSKGT